VTIGGATAGSLSHIEGGASSCINWEIEKSESGKNQESHNCFRATLSETEVTKATGVLGRDFEEFEAFHRFPKGERKRGKGQTAMAVISDEKSLHNAVTTF